MAKRTSERVHFRLIRMNCCGQLLCWINPRWPNYCPECGKFGYPTFKQGLIGEDNEAILKVTEVFEPTT